MSLPRLPRRSGRLPSEVGTSGPLSFMVVWTAIVLLPLVGLLLWSVLEVDGFRIAWVPTIDAYLNLFESGRWIVTVRTIRIALVVTVIELLLAIPFAYWVAKVNEKQWIKIAVLVAMTIPFFLSIVSRTIVWRAILGINGPINALLVSTGIAHEPLDWLLFSEFSVTFGFIGPYFPTMFFPIFMSMALIDDELIEASRDLGGNPATTFANVILPLALPGMLVGVIFTFIPLIGDSVVPELLGGGRVVVLASSVDSLLKILNYPTAAALSVVMLGAMIGQVVVMYFLFGRRVNLELLLGGK